MDELEKSLLDIYSTKTGKDVQSIQDTWMQRGKDTWFNAKDAVQQKLVDEIFDGVIKKSPSKNKTAQEHTRNRRDCGFIILNGNRGHKAF